MVLKRFRNLEAFQFFVSAVETKEFGVLTVICSACYQSYIPSSDVLTDKFHTAADKLTRLGLCCLTRGHSSLILTERDGELAAAPVPLTSCLVWVCSARCDMNLCYNLQREAFRVPSGFCSCVLYGEQKLRFMLALEEVRQKKNQENPPITRWNYGLLHRCPK